MVVVPANGMAVEKSAKTSAARRSRASRYVELRRLVAFRRHGGFDQHEAIGVWKWQRPDEHAVDQRERRCPEPESERERADRERGISRRSREATNRQSKILSEPDDQPQHVHGVGSRGSRRWSRSHRAGCPAFDLRQRRCQRLPVGHFGRGAVERIGLGTAGHEGRVIRRLELQRELVDDLPLAFRADRQRREARADVVAPIGHAGLTRATRSSASKKSRQTRRRSPSTARPAAVSR